MLNKIFKNIKRAETLGFIVLCFLGVLYFYFNPTVVKESQVQVVTITLSERPELSPATYEIPSSLKIIDKEYKQRFELKDCALNSINEVEVLSLEVGDKLRITAKTSELNSGQTFINNYISVYGIELLSGKKLLDFENYKSCKRNSWKKIYVIGVLFIIIFIIGLVKKK